MLQFLPHINLLSQRGSIEVVSTVTHEHKPFPGLVGIILCKCELSSLVERFKVAFHVRKVVTTSPCVFGFVGIFLLQLELTI